MDLGSRWQEHLVRRARSGFAGISEELRTVLNGGHMDVNRKREIAKFFCGFESAKRSSPVGSFVGINRI